MATGHATVFTAEEFDEGQRIVSVTRDGQKLVLTGW
jgi:hypothetical protein